MRAFVLLGALAFFGLADAGERGAPVNAAALMAPAPAETLGAYRLFRDAGARAPNAGLIPYRLNTELYSDGALKFRYVFLPEGARATYDANGVFDFPVGAVLVKTFAVAPDMRRPDENVRFIETRLLIRQARGWRAETYVWNAAQDEARLALAGGEIPLRWIDRDGADVSLIWAAPNRNQCAGCHAQNGAVAPIGPSARNLNGDYPYSEGAQNQLAAWQARGLLDGAPADAPRAAPAHDPSEPLEARARAYLDVNCAHCHNPDGPAHTSGLDLSAHADEPFRWGLYKRPIAAGRGSAGLAFSIEPGAPERSILLHRMESLDPGVMMPELGRQRIDREGVSLIRDWIAALDENGRVALAQSPAAP